MALKIAVTGADGLIGWHLRAFWNGIDGIAVAALNREHFHDSRALSQALDGADAVVHLAALNRGEDKQILHLNRSLTERLIEHLPAGGQAPHVVFSSSTHRDRDTAYGQSKRQSADLLSGWAERNGGRFTEWVLPNVFCEHGRPFHNSAISTFCRLLADGEAPRLIQDQELEWLHAQRAAESAHRLIDDPLSRQEAGVTRVEQIAGTPLRVSEVLNKLQSFDRDYRAGIVPAIDNNIDRDLFNTYRSYLYPGHFPVFPTLHSDPRGRLFESVKARSGGQCFLSTTVPGAERGGHYHRRKYERFLVVEGRARIRVRRLLTDQVDEFEVSGDRPAYVDMPTLHTHDLKNIGDGPLVTLFWADEIFDPENPDTLYEPVTPAEIP